jgi:glycosyltransferase A (GT-A) superfamily protein (DUF2064 family)
MESAESEPVKLKAATEILDRAGVRGGIEVDTSVNIDVRPAASIIAERLQRLTTTAAEASAKLSLATGEELPTVDAEVVEDGGQEEKQTND